MFFSVWIQCNFRAEVRDITVPNYFQKWARFYCTTAPRKGSTAICLLICQVPIIISDLHYFRLQWPLPYNESPDSNLCWGTAVIYHSWMILSKEYRKCRVSTKMTVFLDHLVKTPCLNYNGTQRHKMCLKLSFYALPRVYLTAGGVVARPLRLLLEPTSWSTRTRTLSWAQNKDTNFYHITDANRGRLLITQ